MIDFLAICVLIMSVMGAISLFNVFRVESKVDEVDYRLKCMKKYPYAELEDTALEKYLEQKIEWAMERYKTEYLVSKSKEASKNLKKVKNGRKSKRVASTISTIR